MAATRILAGITIAYLVWVAAAGAHRRDVLVQRRAIRTNWQGFSLRWYWGDQTAVGLARRLPATLCCRR